MKGALKVCIYCCRFIVYFSQRTREQTQARLGAEADADGAKFADKLGICIYEASGGDARCESGLSCIKPVGPVLQANPDCQAAYLHPYRTLQIQCELGAEYQT